MRKIINGAVLAVVSILLLYLLPDTISMIFVSVMVALVFVGYVVGIRRINGFSEGFIVSIGKINDMKAISVSEKWLYIKQIDSMFYNRYLDIMFLKYVKKVEEVKICQGEILPDIEDSINEDYLSLKCQKNFLGVIPGALTGIGILGTFYGLIEGLGGIRFTSVEVVIESISTLVGGIDTAFFTSIAGVTLSIIFEIIMKVSWNNMMVNMLEFFEKFHSRIIPSESDQKDNIRMAFYKKVLDYIERDTEDMDTYEKEKI